MPLGLYTPLVTGIGDFDFGILVPAGIGAILTVILLAKAVDLSLIHILIAVLHRDRREWGNCNVAIGAGILGFCCSFTTIDGIILLCFGCL